MPKIDADFKEKLESISKKDLEKVIIKFASRNDEFYNYLLINYTDPESGEEDLFENAKADLSDLFNKSFRGYAVQLRLANMIKACSKRIGEFTKVCKKKKLEADLLMLVLKEIFTNYEKYLGTCFTPFDSQVGRLVKRMVTLLNSKLHPDYVIVYKENINSYLLVLHRVSNHINFIFDLPESV